MKKLESELEKKCCKFARSHGVAAVKLENCGHRGIPDRQFIFKGGTCFFVEFKTPNGNGKLSDEQVYWREFLGWRCVGCDDYGEFVKLFMSWIELCK